MKYRIMVSFEAKNDDEAKIIRNRISHFVDQEYGGELDNRLWCGKIDVLNNDQKVP